MLQNIDAYFGVARKPDKMFYLCSKCQFSSGVVFTQIKKAVTRAKQRHDKSSRALSYSSNVRAHGQKFHPRRAERTSLAQ